MKNTLYFLIFVVAVVGVLYFLSSKEYPDMPSDRIHNMAIDPAICNGCHGPDGKFPKKPGHPPKEACLKCHKLKTGRNK